MGKIPIGCFPIEFREQGAPKLDGHFSFEQCGDLCGVTKERAFVSCDFGDISVSWIHSNGFDEDLFLPYLTEKSGAGSGLSTNKPSSNRNA